MRRCVSYRGGFIIERTFRCAAVSQIAVKSTSTDDSGALLRLAADGDERALAQLYDLHAPAIYRVLMAMLNSESDAEDLLQNIYVKVAEGRVQNVENARAYLLTMARRAALDVLRRRKRESTSCEEGLHHEANVCEWQSVLQLLPPEQREVVVLKTVEEMTFKEISKVLKISQNTVASRYRYGIEKLRALLREEDHAS